MIDCNSLDFNPRPPCGGRHKAGSIKRDSAKFQSTSSVWRTTWLVMLLLVMMFYFNPRPPCGGRPGFLQINALVRGISIHVLRVEDDVILLLRMLQQLIFQSTSSVWRTTSPSGRNLCVVCYFNPRPPCGGRHTFYASGIEYEQFQSTSSVWRTTSGLAARSSKASYFNPRPPCGGRPGAKSLEYGLR